MAQAGPPAEAEEPARASRRHLKLALRVAAGVLVLALVVWYADPAQLAHKLSRANAWLFALCGRRLGLR
jgi:ferric-dicitrate binding protein FerR (iron transport regulator)